MKKLLAFIVRIIHLLTLPISAMFLHKTQRVRVVMISGDSILLMRSYLGHQQWSLPGGGIHRNESAAKAAVREVAEEVGLDYDLDQIKIIGNGRSPVGLPHTYAYITYFLLNTMTLKSPTIRRPLEVIEAAWWPLAKLPKNISPTVDTALSLVNKHKRVENT